MSRHDDMQRKKDSEQMRQVRASSLAARKAAARRVYEEGKTMDEAAQLGRADTVTVKKWAREGGWKRGQS
jgi:hypothetical protein